MDSELAKKLKLKYSPVAVLFSDEKPQGALEFAEGRWGCVATMLAAAAKGRQAVFSRTTFGCQGGGIGLGFVNQYSANLEHFLSTGTEEIAGTAIIKTPELAKDFLEPYTKVDPIA